MDLNREALPLPQWDNELKEISLLTHQEKRKGDRRGGEHRGKEEEGNRGREEKEGKRA